MHLVLVAHLERAPNLDRCRVDAILRRLHYRERKVWSDLNDVREPLYQATFLDQSFPASTGRRPEVTSGGATPRAPAISISAEDTDGVAVPIVGVTEVMSSKDGIKGPAVVEEKTTTIVVPIGWTAYLDPRGHYEIPPWRARIRMCWRWRVRSCRFPTLQLIGDCAQAAVRPVPTDRIVAIQNLQFEKIDSSSELMRLVS